MTPLNEIPGCETGAPLPFILSDEHHLEVIYHISGADEDRFSDKYDYVIEEEGEGIVALRFQHCLQHKFGYPNEEALHGHPEYKMGIKYFCCVEFPDSKWAAEIEKQNEAHPNHQRGMYSNHRHFIFPFHDTTLECLATGFEVRTYKAWQHQVLLERLKAFSEWLREDLTSK